MHDSGPYNIWSGGFVIRSPHTPSHLALAVLYLCFSAGICSGCIVGTSGSSPDVSSRLLDICDVMDACEGLSIEAVIAAAERELKLSGSPGEQRLSGLETVSVDVGLWMHHVRLLGLGGESAARLASKSRVGRPSTCVSDVWLSRLHGQCVPHCLVQGYGDQL